MQNTYWNQNGTFQSDYDHLKELVPMSGNCHTVAGEMIRAVTRLAHDLYNNGMGNNTSGAVNYLSNRNVIDCKTTHAIHPFTMGRHYEGSYNGDSLQVAIESAIDQTIQHILNNPELETQQNDDDMFLHEDEDERYCEECGDTLGSFDDHTCEDCENTLNEMWEEEEEDEWV